MLLFPENSRPKELLIRVLFITGGVFCLTSLVLLVAGAPPWPAFYHLFVGALGSWSKLAQVLTVWIPLTLCACGLLYSFRIGLWNIGVEGQVVAGAIASTAVLRFGLESGSPSLMIVMAFAGGMLGGSVWAILAGFLKTKGGVNEIFGGLGLNFVAQGITLWLIFGPWKRPGVASMSGTELFPESLWLPTFLSEAFTRGPGAHGAGLVAATWVLNRTRLGLALKGIGSNRKGGVSSRPEPEHLLYPCHGAGRRVCRLGRSFPGHRSVSPPHSCHLQQLRLSCASGGDARQLSSLGIALDCLLFCVPECGKHSTSHRIETGFLLERDHPGSLGADNPSGVWAQECRLKAQGPRRRGVRK